MRRIMIKSKIHDATITQTELTYTGSITIVRELMECADIIEHERVQVVNLNNGARFETYVIEGESGTGIIGLNGPAARLACKGDKIHIISYVTVSESELQEYKPSIIILNDKNEVIQEK